MSDLVHDLKLRLDGFVNLMTGFGAALGDKVNAAFHQRRGELSPRYLTDLYTENWLARRACTVYPDEMLRPGYELSCGDVELATAVRMRLDELQAVSRLKEALAWARVHGGCAIFVGADDGLTDFSLPLNTANIRRIDGLTIIERERCVAAKWYGSGPKLGRPETWRIYPVVGDRSGAQLEVHESRLVILDGLAVASEDRVARSGWGQSALQLMHEVIRDNDQSWHALAHMIQSANMPVWKFKNLLKQLNGNDAAAEFFRTRLALTQSMMGINRGIQLDADSESFERMAAQFSGVPESMYALMQLVSAAADGGMPAMVLFGQSPSGMSATGEYEMAWFYDRADTKRREEVKPALEQLIRLVFLEKEGPTRGKEPESWDLKFPDMQRMTELQQADLRNKQAQTDAIEMQWGVLTAEMVRKNRHRPEGWSWRTEIDSEDEAKLERSEELLPEDKALLEQGAGSEEPPADETTATPNVDPKAALQAGQITALLGIVQSVAKKEIPRETGVALLVASFPIDEATAERIMGDVGDGFTKEPAPAPAFGAPPPKGAFGGAPETPEQPEDEVKPEPPKGPPSEPASDDEPDDEV